jgi:hypothetical protein
MSRDTHSNMSVNDTLSSSSSSIRAPSFKGNYAEWRPGTEAAFFKGGLDNVHLTVIVEFKKLEECIIKWDTEENNAAMALALGGKGSSTGKGVTFSSTSSTSAGGTPPTKADTDKVEEESARKKVRSLITRSRKAYAIIFESLPADLQAQAATLIQGYAFGLWEFLEKKFQNTEQDNIADLYTKWNKLHMDEEESFDSYKARVDRIATLLEKAKDKPSKGQYMYRLIYELRPEFKPVVLALATGDKLKDHDNIKWDTIVGHMNVYERDQRRLSSDKESSQTSATVAAAMGNSLSGDRGRVQGKTSNLNTSTFICHFCNQKGHIKATCKKWLEQQLQLVQHRAHSASTTTKSGVPLVRCTNCGSTRHATADHDESKVPAWRRKGTSTASANGQRADAATSQSSTNTTDSNRYSSLTMNEELSSEQGQNSPRMATCAIVCVGISGSTTDPTSRRAAAKVTQKGVLSSKSATEPVQHLMKEKENTQLNLALKRHKWGIDTMASVHICGNKTKFIGGLRPCSPIPVQVANSDSVMVTQMGNVFVDTPSADGKTMVRFTLVNVLYHEKFSVNLISWGKLKELKWELFSSNKESYLTTPENYRIKLQTIDGVIILNSSLYSIPVSQQRSITPCAYALPTSLSPKWNSIQDLILMHHRLGHVGFDTMIKMIKMGKADGLGEINLSQDDLHIARERIMQCKACVEGKGTKAALGHRGLDRGTSPFEVMHLDSYSVNYPSSDDSHIIKSYGVTLTDPYSGLTSSLTSMSKEPIPNSIIEYFTMIQRQTNNRLKRIYCDGGTEFINQTLKDWCKKEGVQLHWSPKETPQLNGISERHVRTHKEGTRTLMIHSGLPIRFWRYAVSHFVTVRNRSYVSDTTGTTPYEALYGKKPSVQHFGVFGCDAHYHISRKDRSAMQSKMQPGIYLGHDADQGCSIIYRLKERDCIKTKDVRFHLKQFHFASALTNGTVQSILDSPSNYIQSDSIHPQGGINLERINEEDTITVSESADTYHESKQDEEPNLADGPILIDNDEAAAAEQKAIEDALAMQVLTDMITTVADKAATACSASNGIHQLEKQTPRSYREALTSARRDD